MRDEPIQLYEPLDVLKPVGPDIWIVDGPRIDFSSILGSFPFPTRMTVVRLANGELWLHSPTQPSEELFERVIEIGPVRHLIAPNPLHYWWVPDWKARFPEALVHAVPGLNRKAKRPVPIDRTLDDRRPAWPEEIDQVTVSGTILTEVDFFHRASRTLILTDLIENFEAARVTSPWLRLILRLGGALDPDGKAPRDMQLSFWRRRAAVRQAVKRMIGFEPARIVIAHGRCYENDAVAELRRAFRWVL